MSLLGENISPGSDEGPTLKTLDFTIHMVGR